MATIAFTLISVCSGGEHATIGVSLNGGAVQEVHYGLDEIRTALTEEQRDAATLVLTKLATQGLTRAQARTKFQNGFTVTV